MLSNNDEYYDQLDQFLRLKFTARRGNPIAALDLKAVLVDGDELSSYPWQI